MKFDVQFGALLEDAATAAAQVEADGFDGLWTTEAGHDPFLPIALAAQATERITLGTSIAVAFGRSPMSMAQVAWDLQKLSKGRLRLGLGTQVRAHIERRYGMTYDRPVARLIDYVDCMRAIWRNFQVGGKPDHRGEFFQFTLMNPLFGGGPIDHPDVQVQIAGVNPRICKAAGEVADGFHVHPVHTRAYLEQVVLPGIEEGAKSRGRKRSEIETYAGLFTVTGDTQEAWDASLEQVRGQIAFYGSTPSYRIILETHGLGDLARQLSDLARRGEWKAMGKLIPDSFLEEVAVVAKPSELAEAIATRRSGLLDRVSLYFGIQTPEAQPSEESKRAFIQRVQAGA